MKAGVWEKLVRSRGTGEGLVEQRKRRLWAPRRHVREKEVGAVEVTAEGSIQGLRTERRTNTGGLIHPITEATDPRWVLAVRTAEQLQGSILTMDRRERLVRLGKLMGLTAFQANLIIAIVQDQARRGVRPENCPTAGLAQLEMIAPAGEGENANRRQALRIAAMVTAILAIEVLMLIWWLG